MQVLTLRAGAQALFNAADDLARLGKLTRGGSADELAKVRTAIPDNLEFGGVALLEQGSPALRSLANDLLDGAAAFRGGSERADLLIPKAAEGMRWLLGSAAVRG